MLLIAEQNMNTHIVSIFSYFNMILLKYWQTDIDLNQVPFGSVTYDMQKKLHRDCVFLNQVTAIAHGV